MPAGAEAKRGPGAPRRLGVKPVTAGRGSAIRCGTRGTLRPLFPCILMVKAWRAGPGGTYNCPHCRAVYEVSVKRAALKAEGSATCEFCGSVMAEWHGKVIPSFKSVPDPDRKGRSEGNVAQAVVAAIAGVPVVAAIAEVLERAVGRVASVDSTLDSEELTPTKT
jgi:hypothetical protein